MAKLTPSGGVLVVTVFRRHGRRVRLWPGRVRQPRVPGRGNVLTSAGQRVEHTPHGSSEGFVAHMSTNGALFSSTFIGGRLLDDAQGVAVDPSGRVWVSGFAMSTDLVSATTAFQGRTRRLRMQAEFRCVVRARLANPGCSG